MLDPQPTPPEVIDLRQQAHYWRALHGRAVEREQYWKGRCEQLEAQVGQQALQLEIQAQQIEALKAHVAWLQQQVFGRKSEATKPPLAESPGENAEGASSLAADAEGRRRGKQPGAQGYGRQLRVGLPREEVVHELPAAAQPCPQCGKPLTRFPTTEDSEEIHWAVRLIRRVHQRARYRPSCDCRAVAGMVTAPLPAKLIPKGLFSTGFWVQVLLEKFLFQRPLYRLRQRLAWKGCRFPKGR